jgi:hypothetical protein
LMKRTQMVHRAFTPYLAKMLIPSRPAIFRHQEARGSGSSGTDKGKPEEFEQLGLWKTPSLKLGPQ